jgi:4-hydroxybutyrate CoA-transferase
LQDYIPMSLSAIPRLLEEKRLHVDVAIIKVTLPHKGFVSLGMGVDLTRYFIRHAKLVIAEVNSNMPWTEGHSKIPVTDIDWWIPVDTPLLTSEQLWPDFMKRENYPFRVLNKIGRNIVKETPDRATLRFGVHPVSMAVLPFLQQRKDLGIHTDIFTQSMMKLMEEGVITNQYKTTSTRAAPSLAKRMETWSCMTIWIAIQSLNSTHQTILAIPECWPRFTT